MFFCLLYLCSVKMGYRAIRVEGRVLACRSKSNDNKRLPKNMLWFYKFCLCMQILRMNFYEPLWFLVLWNSGLKLKMAIAWSHANVPVYLVNKRLLFLDSVVCKLFLKPIVNSMFVVIDRDLFKGVWVPEMLLNFENCLAYW